MTDQIELESLLKSIDEKLDAEIEPITDLQRERDLLAQRLDFIDDYISRLTKLQKEAGVPSGVTVKDLKAFLGAIGAEAEGNKEELVQKVSEAL